MQFNQILNMHTIPGEGFNTTHVLAGGTCETAIELASDHGFTSSDSQYGGPIEGASCTPSGRSYSLTSTKNMVFAYALRPWSRITFLPQPSVYYTSSSRWYQVRHGGTCPGDHVAACTEDWTQDLSWINVHPDDTQQVYFIKSGGSDANQDFDLTWNVSYPGAIRSDSLADSRMEARRVSTLLQPRPFGRVSSRWQRVLSCCHVASCVFAMSSETPTHSGVGFRKCQLSLKMGEYQAQGTYRLTMLGGLVGRGVSLIHVCPSSSPGIGRYCLGLEFVKGLPYYTCAKTPYIATPSSSNSADGGRLRRLLGFLLQERLARSPSL